MTQTTFTELRKHAKAYFDSVEKGETIRVMRHGKVIAEIVPPGRSTGPQPWKRPGLKLRIAGPPASRTIIQERRESRF